MKANIILNSVCTAVLEKVCRSRLSDLCGITFNFYLWKPLSGTSFRPKQIIIKHYPSILMMGRSERFRRLNCTLPYNE